MAADRRSVLVTGAGGFLGRRLAGALATAGARVLASVRGAGAASAEAVVRGDLARPAVRRRVEEAMRRRRVGAVFHLAAEGNAASAAADPAGAFEDNVALTRWMLDASRRAGVRHFLFASTGLVYGAGRGGLRRESEAPAPRTVYAAGKLAAEALVQGDAAAYGFAADVVRLANLYGPESPEGSVIGRVLSQARSGGDARVGNLAAVRDFLHVEDAAAGLVRLWRSAPKAGCRVLNLATGRGTSVRDLARSALRAAGRGAGRVRGTAGPRDSLVLSPERMRRATGWRPAFSLEAGLRACLGGAA